MIFPFYPFLNGDNKTIFKIWNNSLSLVILSSNPNYHIYWTLQIFWEERWRGRQKWLLLLKINITIFKTELLSSIAWIDPNLPICYGISKPPKFNTNFRCRIILADAHSKHILIILVIDSRNFRKLQEWFSEFERDENMTQKSKSKRLLIKRWSFSRMSILIAQNSISWLGLIQMMLFCLYNIKNMKSVSYHPKAH